MLEIIAKNADSNPNKSMKLLRLSYSISRGENRDIIKKEDTEKAVELSTNGKVDGE